MILTRCINKNPRLVGKILGITGALITLVIPYYIMLTNHHVETSQSFCPMKLLTGLPCPGCGITKSLIFAYHGDLLKSLSYHIFGIPLIIGSMVALVVLSMEIITKKEYFNSILYSRKLAYFLAYILAGYHLIRTIVFIAQNSWMDILRESIWM